MAVCATTHLCGGNHHGCMMPHFLTVPAPTTALYQHGNMEGLENLAQAQDTWPAKLVLSQCTVLDPWITCFTGLDTVLLQW